MTSCLLRGAAPLVLKQLMELRDLHLVVLDRQSPLSLLHLILLLLLLLRTTS